MLKETSALRIARIAVVAALYVALTVAIAPLGFGSIQFRFSELLMLLCFRNRDYCISLTLGCLIANLFSPFALFDVPFGTLATLIAALLMLKIKNIWLASLIPTLTNGIIVGIEVALIYSLPIPLTMLTVGVGEFAVVTVIGAPLFKFLLFKSPAVTGLLGSVDKRLRRAD